MAIEELSDILDASRTHDVYEFMKILFPERWHPIAARIIESGAEFADGMCLWAPRWSKIPFTVKKGKSELETALKTCMYRAHDCFHQLWGLPVPQAYDEDNFYIFKRAQMCGEVAVLTITEFLLAQHLCEKFPLVEPLMMKRNAIQMLWGPLRNKTPQEIVLRMDDMLHKKSKPRWVRHHKESSAFYDDYVPMLEADRVGIDNNWGAMVASNWSPQNIPNTRYSADMDGLELTLWMINDFFHLMSTDEQIDEGLAKFNRERRNEIILPKNWV